MSEPGSVVILELSSLEGSIRSLNSAVSGVTIAETSDFIHIKPDTIEVHLLVKIRESLGPDCLGCRVEPIKEDISIGTIGPNELRPDLLLNSSF
jgi:hypothetical protein